jgi:O-antigen ligase
MTTADASATTRRPAPPRPDTLQHAFSVLLLFTLIAGDFWRNLISWGGWIALALALGVVSVVWLIRRRPAFGWRIIPKTLVLFLAYATASIAWSDYPGASVLGVLAQLATTTAAVFLALCLDWKQLLRALGSALRWVIGLSLLFELIVAVIIRHPIIPLWVDYGSGKLPQAFYWSRDLLFHGGQIQGIVGNSNLLAMAALLAGIVFGIQLFDGTVRRIPGAVWLALAAASFLLSRSSTVIVAVLVTAAALGFALWTRRIRQERRWLVYSSAVALLVVAVLGVLFFWNEIVKLFGKSDDLTGRLTIWKEVTALAVERRAFGWGWVSYWAPWVKPFKDLAIRNKVEYLQAHNAWLDVWFQLGIVGLIIFILLVFSTLRRSWFLAVDRPRTGLDDNQPFTALTLLPLLLMAALLAQSLAESRMLVEGGWTLLVALAIKTKTTRT